MRTRARAAVGGACEFTAEMLPALERAVDHPGTTEELAEILTTPPPRSSTGSKLT
jgi:hypothetical protein